MLWAALAFSLFAGAETGFARETALQRQTLNASAIAVADRFGADAGEAILRQGGNAVDAAVAIAFTLAVTYPEAGNIGGGGFMTLNFDRKPYFLDFRERAPLAASRDMYLDDTGKVIPGSSVVGPRSVAVPGTVAGMWRAHQRFGKLEWKKLLAPAIRYAREGFEPSRQLLERSQRSGSYFGERTNFSKYFGTLREGEIFRQPELAVTLQRISNEGAKDFYEGRTAELISAGMEEGLPGGKGLITRKDLHQYKAVWREPLVFDWKGYRIVTAPPPSSGGIALAQLLKMKANLKDSFAGLPLNSTRYIHLVAEIEKRVFADRAQYLGDPDFHTVPVEQLLDETYLARRSAEVDVNGQSNSELVRPGLEKAVSGRLEERPRERAETTHYSLVDKWGNAVAVTYTINGYFGSGVVVPGAGFLLNDEMDDFSAKPGVANRFGVIGQDDANLIEPGKRPLSSMAPTILTKERDTALVLGTPGGSRIFTSIFQVLIDIEDFKLPLPEAVGAARFHHQLLPAGTIFMEPYKGVEAAAVGATLDSDRIKQLEAMGYVLKTQGFSGDIQAVEIVGNTPQPVSDPRGRGVTRVIPDGLRTERR